MLTINYINTNINKIITMANKMCDLNESRIKQINETISSVTNNLTNLIVLVDVLKKINFETEQQNESKTSKCLIESIDNSLNDIKKDISMLQLNKLKILKKTSSERLIEMSVSEDTDVDDEDSVELINSDCIDDLFVDTDFNIDSDDFHVYSVDISNENGRLLLCGVVYKIFTKALNLELLNISRHKLKKFIIMVSNFYRLNPYHNLAHAVMVMQSTYILLTKYNLKNNLLPIEIFALLVSSYVHDIDHPGHTNAFEQKTMSNLALTYNDNSVLENHHCSTAFYIMHLKGINLLSDVTIDDFRIFRDTVIQTIMMTDMKFHNALINKLENIYDVNKLPNIILCEMIIHVADLSNQIRPFNVSFIGSKGLKREFANQVKKEENLNLPSMPFMKITSDKDFYKNEIDFCNFVVNPLIKQLIRLYPNTSNLYNNLKFNVSEWEKLYDSLT
jgi:hypothetical protein